MLVRPRIRQPGVDEHDAQVAQRGLQSRRVVQMRLLQLDGREAIGPCRIRAVEVAGLRVQPVEVGREARGDHFVSATSAGFSRGSLYILNCR